MPLRLGRIRNPTQISGTEDYHFISLTSLPVTNPPLTVPLLNALGFTVVGNQVRNPDVWSYRLVAPGTTSPLGNAYQTAASSVRFDQLKSDHPGAETALYGAFCDPASHTFLNNRDFWPLTPTGNPDWGDFDLIDVSGGGPLPTALAGYLTLHVALFPAPSQCDVAGIGVFTGAGAGELAGFLSMTRSTFTWYIKQANLVNQLMPPGSDGRWKFRTSAPPLAGPYCKLVQ